MFSEPFSFNLSEPLSFGLSTTLSFSLSTTLSVAGVSTELFSAGLFSVLETGLTGGTVLVTVSVVGLFVDTAPVLG